MDFAHQGLWVANPHLPTQWTQKRMGSQGLWVIQHMGYEGVHCTVPFQLIHPRV